MDRTASFCIEKSEPWYFNVTGPNYILEKIGFKTIDKTQCQNKKLLFSAIFLLSDVPETYVDIKTRTITIKGPLSNLSSVGIYTILHKLIQQTIPFIDLFALDLSIFTTKEECVGLYFPNKNSLFFEKSETEHLLNSIPGLKNCDSRFGLNFFDKELNFQNKYEPSRQKLNKILIVNYHSTNNPNKLIEKQKSKHILTSYIISCNILMPIVIPEWECLLNPLIEFQHQIERYGMIRKIACLPIIKVNTTYDNLTSKIQEACMI